MEETEVAVAEAVLVVDWEVADRGPDGLFTVWPPETVVPQPEHAKAIATTEQATIGVVLCTAGIKRIFRRGRRSS